MPSNVERLGNLLTVINEYDLILAGLKKHIESARKNGNLEEKALSLVYMIQEASLAPATLEILITERALYKINAPKAFYRQRRRKQKKVENLNVNTVESYAEFNQDLNDYDKEDDI